MGAEILASETRLRILKILAEGASTPSEISKKLGKSLPTITRHLACLESSGFAARAGEKKGTTRPYTKYALRESIVLIKAVEGDVGISSLPLTEDAKVQLRIWSIPQQRFHYYVGRFFWQIQDLIPKIEAIAVYGSVARGDAREDSDVDVLILAREDIEEIKRQCEAMILKKPREKAKMVMAQVFKPEEFERALKSGSDFAKEIVESMMPLYDPKKLLKKLKVK